MQLNLWQIFLIVLPVAVVSGMVARHFNASPLWQSFATATGVFIVLMLVSFINRRLK